ncbi:venom protease-like [Panulirus ornatus]|uniref:venom protease-like n=1 Tax=Panulirus ornatus TaxID=150431 RepID=UPI003A8A197A
MKFLNYALLCGLVLLAYLLSPAQSQRQELRARRRMMCDGVCKAFTCGTPNRDGRVVGGVQTSPGEYPWLVSLFHRRKLYCSATLVTDRHLITAAHCLKRVTKASMDIVLGMYNKTNPNEATRQVRKAEQWWAHKDFERRSFNNDIGIILLNESVTITKYVRPVCLPESLDRDYVGEMGIVAGWGRQSEDGKPSTILREVSVPIMSNAECKTTKYKPQEITSNMMCAGYTEGKIDACQGDSGGPLVFDNGASFDIIGVVSWGQGCARARYPGVYTRISKYWEFITSKINLGCSCPRP